MRSVMMPLAAVAMLATAVPALAQNQNYNDGRYDRQNDRRDDRQYSSRGEVERSRDRVQEERQDFRQAQRSGNRGDIREEKREYQQARREFQQDSRDWQNSRKRQIQENRQDARYWNQGRNYNYNRPDPRYNGYYADNYYRGGNYQARQLNANDRIYRGNDNRYYCRRSDGTTGLIIGALGGGVLGNVIAPGGSKTIGSILGGGLGAVLGNAISRNNVTCR